jgi:hypothetical protein
MASDEKESLLGGSDGSGYGADSGSPDSDAQLLGTEGSATGVADATGMATGNTAAGGDAMAKRGRSTTRKDRLPKRNPSLEKVVEDIRGEKMPTACPNYFGVKSYLHDFYDTHFYKDPDIYEEEEDDFRYLLNPNPRRRCTSIWWKVFVWIGANFLVFGIIGVLVGYLVPQRPIIVGSLADNIELIDKEAISFNFNLDVCKLVGLILFCIGGLTLTVALLFPSFLYQYCDDERRNDAFKVRVGDDSPPLKSPVEMTLPATTKISNVQPDRKNESIVTQEGMIPFKD